MKPIVIATMLIFAVSGCGTAASTPTAAPTATLSNSDMADACFPNTDPARIPQQMGGDNFAKNVLLDDFGSMAITAKRVVHCDRDTAFAILWYMYSAASQANEHPIIDKVQAEAAFDRNWR